MNINLDSDKKIATRESYGNTLAEMGKEYENLVVLDADLADSTKTGVFKKAFPERHFDCGIAEGHMMAMAAGLAACGKVVFASSFAMFATGRAFEQIRNSIAHTGLNVKVAASHAGITVGEDGATHQCLEDIALMRTLPGMMVVVPADDVEAKAAVRAAYHHEGPVYIRLGRQAVPVFNDADSYVYDETKAVVLKEGTDLTIMASGIEVYESLLAARMLDEAGINAEVINVHTIKPLDEETIIESLKKTGRGVTVEEHSVIGGLFSAVSEACAKKYPVSIMPIGIEDVFGYSGSAGVLLKEFGLDSRGIYDKILKYMK